MATLKFTNGYWLTRKEYDVNSPAEAFEAEKDGKTLNVYAPYKRINTRGDELNLGMSTIKLTSPVENVIGVKLTHFDQDTKGPSYELNDLDPDVNIDVTDKKAPSTSGDLTVSLPLRQQFDMEFTANGKVITASRNKAQGEILNHDTNVHYMREQLSVGVEDKIYGLGERFGNFIKNGQEVKITNQDGGTASEQSYKNIPFYLTDAGYGVFVDEPQTVDF